MCCTLPALSALSLFACARESTTAATGPHAHPRLTPPKNNTGALNPAEFAAYTAYAAGKAPWAPAVATTLAACAQAAGLSPTVGREPFVSLVRAQAAAVCASPGGPLDAPGAAGLVPQEVARLSAQNGLTKQELLLARWSFLLLDLDNDNSLRLSDLRRAGGVEAGLSEARGLLDPESDADLDAERTSLVTFEEYVSSTYARPKEPFKAAAVLLANTIAVYFILQAPVDVLVKGAAVAAMLIRPQLLARPVIWLHDLIMGLINGARARQELARRGAAA